MQAYSPTPIIRVEMLPYISELLSSLFRQLQFAGLLIANFETAPREPNESFLDRFGLRPALLHSIIAAVEMYMPGVVTICNVPAISNRAHWANPNQLGGYSGRDLVAKPGDIITSYLGCWQHGVQYPRSAPNRFVRLAFWYWLERGNVLDGLGLLLDLYGAGFMLTQQSLAHAFLTVADAYTQEFDISVLKRLDFSSEKADDVIHEAIESVSKDPHGTAKAQAVAEWLLDRAITEGESARESSCLDHWLIRKTQLQGTVQVLHSLDIEHCERLTGVQRVMASQFEEVRADIGADALTTRLFALSGRPLVERVIGIAGVGLEYQRHYGHDWLDKMLEDRILAPNVLRGRIADAYAGAALPAVREIDLPLEWRVVSPVLAWPLCTAFERDQMIERSTEVDPQDVRAACRELGFEPKPGDADADEEYRDEDQAAARRELSALELSEFFRREELFESDDPRRAIPEFEGAAESFPYNHLMQRELGIRNDQSDNVEAAYGHMRAAVLLEPTDAMNWRSLGVVLRRMGHERDGVFAHAVSEMIEQRRVN
ncbi:MAG: tetratricopeptide repeat protein [Bryobacteraceae bacterium]